MDKTIKAGGRLKATTPWKSTFQPDRVRFIPDNYYTIVKCDGTKIHMQCELGHHIIFNTLETSDRYIGKFFEVPATSPPQQAVSDEEIVEYARIEATKDGDYGLFSNGKYEGIIQGMKAMRERTPPSEAETILADLWVAAARLQKRENYPLYGSEEQKEEHQNLLNTFWAVNKRHSDWYEKWCADNPVTGK